MGKSQKHELQERNNENTYRNFFKIPKVMLTSIIYGYIQYKCKTWTERTELTTGRLLPLRNAGGELNWEGYKRYFHYTRNVLCPLFFKI